MNLWTHIKNRISWQINILTIFILGIYALLYPILQNAQPEWFQENSLVENAQLAILALSLVIALASKNDKPLFVTAALIVILMMMRETNMGRSYFCARYLPAGTACKWDNFTYGYIADIVRIIYCCAILVYAWCQKLHLIVAKYIQKAPLYIIDISLLLISAIVATIAENPFRYEILEEVAETLFYLSMLNCLWKYKQSKL